MTPRSRRPTRLRSSALSLFAAMLFGAIAPMSLRAFTPHPAPGRLLVQVHDWVNVEITANKPGQVPRTQQRGLDALGVQFGLRRIAPQFAGETPASKALAGYDLSRYFVLEFPPDVDLESLRQAYSADPSVARADFDMMMPLDVCVNDAALQWHIQSAQGKDAHATGGWSHSQGDSTVVLAIADTGVDWRHPDLGGTNASFTNGNIYTNWAENNGIPGFDDDHNGKIDDVHGWDFVAFMGTGWSGEDTSDEDADPSDFNGHGTHVAGIAGAITNNGLGVAGVGFRCRILPLRIGGSVNSAGVEQGVVYMSYAAAAINYARAKGAAAVNCSWGSSQSGGLDAAVQSAIAGGMVVVVSAGNDNSQTPSYLGSRGDCLDVAASNESDRKADFSNYGTWIDVTAPGVAIYSTYFDHFQSGAAQHSYATLQGTSMAAPVATGLVGLVKAVYPWWQGPQIITEIKQGCDPLDEANPGFIGKLGAGRVNVLRTFKDRFLTVPGDYCSFDQAFAASGEGDTLALRGGDVINASLYLPTSQRVVLGGWNSSYTARDPIGNPTLVQPVGNEPAVEVSSGVDSTLFVDGFRFSGGVARALSTPVVGPYGGGLLCLDASPVFSRCRFESNTAGSISTFGGGGGGFLWSSSARFSDCVFQSNAAQAGGALYLLDSNVRIERCTFNGNTSFDGTGTTYGSALYSEGGVTDLVNVVCTNNTGADEGGVLYLKSGTATARRLVCNGNGAQNQGGALRVASGGSLVLRDSDVRGGSALFGAGVALASGASLDLEAVVLAGNIANYLGGGIYAQSANATLRNVTFDANRGTLGGGDALHATGSPAPWVLRNSLVTNHPTAANAACVFGGAVPQLDYNSFWNNTGGHVSGGSLGPNDTQVNPLYANAAGGNLALGLHSPALDSGDPAPSANDVDGSRCDRGAYGGPGATSLAPARPTGVQALRYQSPSYNGLSWAANPFPDVQYYAVYRGSSSSFVPSASNLIGTSPAATRRFTDNSGSATDWYRIAAISSTGASSGFSAALQPSNFTDTPPANPKVLALHQNSPNPFNPSTVVRFDLPSGATVALDIFDATGKRVRELVRGWMPAGSHPVWWDGKDDHGRTLASGVYVARLRAGDWSSSRKMILAR